MFVFEVGAASEIGGRFRAELLERVEVLRDHIDKVWSCSAPGSDVKRSNLRVQDSLASNPYSFPFQGSSVLIVACLSNLNGASPLRPGPSPEANPVDILA